MTKRLTQEQVIARSISENELQRNVIEAAEALGYLVAHINDSRRQKAEGLPDLLMVRHGDPPIYAELKREPGGGRYTDLTPIQEVWRDALLASGQRWFLWRPRDWLDGEIEKVLTCSS